MSSSGKPTLHLGLNQWFPNDKPERADFDSDNLKIDAAFSSKVNQTEFNTRVTAVDAALNSKANIANPEITGFLTITRSSVPQVALRVTDQLYAKIFKNASSTVDTGMHIEDYGSDGSTAGIQVRANFARVAPTTDNAIDLGASYLRFRNIFAGTGTINTSDERQKSNIFPLDNIKSFFMALNPIKYRYIDGTSGRVHHGLGAREVEQAMQANGLTDIDFAGLIKSPDEENEGEYIYGLRYSEFIPMLIKMVQDQQKEIDALKAK